MAYKFTTGSVERGDLYNEDDADQNTFIDWGEDSIIFYAGGRGFIKLEDIDPKEVKRFRKTMSMQQIADEIGASNPNVDIS